MRYVGSWDDAVISKMLELRPVALGGGVLAAVAVFERAVGGALAIMMVAGIVQ